MDKTVDTVLAHASLARTVSTALADCTKVIDTSRMIGLTLRVSMTFDDDVDTDPTVALWANSEDNDSTYDTAAWKSWTFPHSAGATVTLHWPEDDEIKPLPKYLKPIVTNNSGAGTDTDITSITIKEVPLAL